MRNYKFEYYKNPINDQWYWRLKALNGEIIASGEGYNKKEDCLHCIDLILGIGTQYEVVAL